MEIITEIIACSKDPVYFAFKYIQTQDVESGVIKPFATFDGKYDKPEYTNEIKKLIRKFNDSRINKKDLHIDKSRQMYVTETFCAYALWCFLFVDNCRVLVTSEKAEKIDKKGAPDTLLNKIRFMLTHLPVWLQPGKKELIDNHMTLFYQLKNSSILGEGGDDPGRQGGVNIAWADEFAHQPHSQQRFLALREATKDSLILCSTPKGKNNKFAAIKFDAKSSFEKLSLIWSLRRVKEWYEMKRQQYSGDEAGLAQEVDISYEGSIRGRAFSRFTPAKHVIDLTADVVRQKIKGNTTIVGIDLGWAHPTCYVFLAKIDGTWTAYDEYEVSETPINVHAQNFKDMLTRWEITQNQCAIYGDPSGAARSRETGEAAYDLFAKSGVRISQANNEVAAGIQLINTLFYGDKLLISSKCARLIDALNEAEFYTNANGEAISEKYKEDWYTDLLDALRYAVMQAEKARPRTGQIITQSSLARGYVRR